MTEIYIKTKTAGRCRVYPDAPNGPQPSVTSICDALMKYGLIQWAADCAVDYLNLYYPIDIKPDSINWEFHKKTMNDARHAHEQIKDEAADFGTVAHKICQLFLERKEKEAYRIRDSLLEQQGEEQWKKCSVLCDSFVEWAEKNKIEPVHTEIVLHGDGYSGRCDLITYRTDPKTKKRVLGLYDIKTGKGVYYPEWGLQLAGYAEAYDTKTVAEWESEPLEIQEIGIIKLNKETLKCNFSESPKPKFTVDRERLTRAWHHLVQFFWAYNDIQSQLEEIKNEAVSSAG